MFVELENSRGMSEPETIYDYMVLAAEKLTGHRVKIRMRAPAYKTFDGLAFVVNGVGYIDLDPTLPDGYMFQALLHECGHLRADLHALSVGADRLDQPPASVDPKVINFERSHNTITKARETAADAWYNVWRNWAQSQYKSYGDASMRPCWRKLLCLLDWKE
jgi:hypothetical protein